MSKFKTEYFYAPLVRTEHDEESGFWFFKETKTVEQYHFEVDLDKYAQGLAEIYNRFDREGYEVVNVIPLQMAHEKPCYQQLAQDRTNYVGSISHGMTQGAMVVGKRKDD